MKEYSVVPETLLAKPDELKKWLDKAFDYANSLPPKVKKARKNKSSADKGGATNRKSSGKNKPGTLR